MKNGAKAFMPTKQALLIQIDEDINAEEVGGCYRLAESGMCNRGLHYANIEVAYVARPLPNVSDGTRVASQLSGCP